MKPLALLALASLTTLSLPAEQPIGLPTLHRLDLLPTFKPSTHVAAISSYDRSGGNDDGFSGKYSFVRQDPQGLILADLKGPGVIYRLWTPTPSDDLLEFFFDGEPQPRLTLKFRDLFLGQHPAFPRPLVGFGAGGYFSYVPLPFSHACVVRLRAPKTQFYQINYALYPTNTPLSTFNPQLASAATPDRDKAIALWQRSGADLSPTVAPPGTPFATHRTTINLTPATPQTLYASQQGGRLLGLRLSPASAIAGKDRDLLLRMRWDDEAPAVLCPLGDFFGYAWGQPAAQSLLIGTAGETNYCYFPMPFLRSATVELISERTHPVQLHAEIVASPHPRQPDEGAFYAVWRRENPTTLGQPFTFLDTQGRGHLVGAILQAQGFESGKTLFFEGDDQTTLDGTLAIHGTGSEDFFNGGWYDVPDRWEKRLSFPLSGCLGYAKHLGRTGAYRLFLGDAYSYRQSIRQTIEHGGEQNSIPTDYSSVTFFYSERPPSSPISLPPPPQRTVTDLAEVVFPLWWQTPIYAWSFSQATLTRAQQRIGPDNVQYLSLRGTNSDWFGPHFLAPVCEVTTAGRYAIFIEAVRGPEQARVQLFQDENPVADPVDLYAESPARSGRLLLGHLNLAEGRNNLMLKLVGQHPKATALGLDLITLICARQP